MEELQTETLSEPASQPKLRALRVLIEFAETAAIALILFLGINLLTARVVVDGSSMEPTLHNRELIIVNRLAFRWSQPKPGDIIVFHLPDVPAKEYIKRVIGLPGDTIEIKGRQVYINDQRIEESYIAALTISSGKWTVPDDKLFVLGDNRNDSADSRLWGFVPLEDVIGKALVVYWPPEDWGILEHAASLAP